MNNYIDIQKTQAGRLWSMLAVSPFLIYVALSNKIPLWARWILFIAGILTIITVGIAYFKTKRANT